MGVTMDLRRVGRPAGLTQVVRGEIERLIISGHLERGSRLPTEKELAERLGVGRSSIREALRALQEVGMVEVIHGKGTFVRNEPQKAIKTQLQFLISVENKASEDLTELRLLLEAGLAGLAARRAGEEELKAIRESMAEMANAQTTGALVEAGANFHLAVVLASKNAIAATLYEAVAQVVKEVYRGQERSRSQKEQSIRDHEEIYQAIFDRDPELAAQKVHDHLVNLPLEFGGYGKPR